MKIIVADNYNALSQIGADLVIDLLKNKKNAVLGLATGTTPIGLYQKLVEAYKQGIVSFKQVKTVNLDEYVGIEKQNEQSYAYFMRKNLFDYVDIDLNNTHIPNGSAQNLQKECIDYSLLLTKTRQDIQILGLGSNGHIGFNEPFTAFDSKTHLVKLSQQTINDNSRLFESKNQVPTHAITMGISEIMAAKRIILLASGKNKAKGGRIPSICPQWFCVEKPAVFLQGGSGRFAREKCRNCLQPVGRYGIINVYGCI